MVEIITTEVTVTKLPIDPLRILSYIPLSGADAYVVGYDTRALLVDGKNKQIKLASDDHAEVLQTAVDRYKKIMVLGELQPTRTINITKSDVRLLGFNPLSSRIVLSTSDDIDLFTLGDGSNFIQHIEIKYLHLKGQSKTAGTGIHDYGCYSCKISDVVIDTFKYGIRLQGTSSQHAREGRILRSYIGGVNQGIRAESYANDYTIALNMIYSTDDHGIALLGSLENTVALNILPYGVGSSGIYGYNANRNLILGNHLYGVGGHGIQFGGSSQNNSIIANYIQGPGVNNPGGYDAIRLFDTASQNQIVANYINGLGRARHGVNTADSTGGSNYIKANTVFGTTSGRYNINTSDYCDDCIYSSLPSSFFLPGALIKYYDGSAYWLALWDGSQWRKVQLS